MKLKTAFFDRVEMIPFHDCWEWIGSKDTGGYGTFPKKTKEGYTNCKAHRLSWEVNIGPIPAGLCVLHKCDNRGCVRPDHLFLGTQKENIYDMLAKKRNKAPQGAAHHKAKLSDIDVKNIRASTGSLKELAAKYSVHTSQISAIRTRRTWKHI